MHVHQVLATLSYGDAIGNEVLAIQRLVREAGHRSDIFVETVHPRLEEAVRDYRELPEVSAPDHILIHHFSICSKASRLAYALPDRMVLVYHNITPASFFVGVHDHLAGLCFFGRRELSAYAGRCHYGLGDSEYNRRELEALGFRPTEVLPVIPDLRRLDAPRRTWTRAMFDDEHTNILFVGRIIPNKRIDDLILTLWAYQRAFNPRSRLIIVGEYRGFETYLASLHHLMSRLGVADVHFVGHVDDEELAGYYDCADVFLCESEHEGFCVPILEAFYAEVPVIAYASTAVPSTMDGAGVLVDSKDPFQLASLIDGIVSDSPLADRIVEGQLAALARAQARDPRDVLLRVVEEVARAAPLPPPAVTYDFWQHLEEANMLEEIRLAGRPSAFKALPEAPNESSVPGRHSSVLERTG